MQAAAPDATVEVWAQDEARIGLKPILRRVWARRGETPIAINHTRYDWLYAYGFVRPADGATWWLLLPTVRVDVMSQALQEFATAHGVGPTRQIVLVLDGAGWHTSPKLEIPDGIHLVRLPPYTPELQPAERLWPLLREVAANRTFADLDALEAVLEERTETLRGQPEVVRDLTRYHWWPSSTVS